jgi:DNA-binding NtrC family response regulator
MKILVVDDEGIVLESCNRVLESEGFEVISVKSADEALAAIDHDQPSLLLIDVKMPVHDGIYLMKELKQRGKDVPIIVMSGYSIRETIEEADLMGASRFLAKPFTPDELLETVREVIERR